MPHRRKAYSLVELIVSIAVVATLTSLILPAVQRVREAASRLTCGNRMKQLALACHAHNDLHDGFPPLTALGGRPLRGRGFILPPGRQITWPIELLPHLELTAVYGRWELQYFVGASVNPAWYGNFAGPEAVGALSLSALKCPSHALNPLIKRFEPMPIAPAGIWKGMMSYRASAGLNAVFRVDQRVGLSDIADGASCTMLLGEHANDEPLWRTAIVGPGDPFVDGPSYVNGGYGDGPYAYAYNPFNYRLPLEAIGAPPGELGQYSFRRTYGFGSDHPGGANVALCDGSVRFINSAVNAAVVTAYGTIDGGEAVTEF